jgi:hypothetical protein
MKLTALISLALAIALGTWLVSDYFQNKHHDTFIWMCAPCVLIISLWLFSRAAKSGDEL